MSLRAVNTVPSFRVAENVLCRHKSLLYNARILKVYADSIRQPHYLLHYIGWNKKWDEIVSEERVFEVSAKNLRRKKSEEDAMNVGGKKGIRLSATRRKPGTSTGSKNERFVAESSDSRSFAFAEDFPLPVTHVEEGESVEKVAQLNPIKLEGEKVGPFVQNLKKGGTEEAEVEFGRKIEVNLTIPSRLRIILAHDYHLIVKEKKLQTLPARCTVEKLLADYLKILKNMRREVSQVEMDYYSEIRDYFELLLRNQGLYEEEFSQYVDVFIFERRNTTVQGKVPPVAKAYGPVHFVRLISRIDNLLVYTTLKKMDVALVRKYTNELLKFIAVRHEEYFVPRDYVAKPPRYYRNLKA